MSELKRGDVIYLNDAVNKALGVRPYLIVSNDVGNHYGNIVLACPLTTKHKKLNQPTHCIIDFHDSMVMCEQVYTIQKTDIHRTAGRVGKDDLERVDDALAVSLGLIKDGLEVSL